MGGPNGLQRRGEERSLDPASPWSAASALLLTPAEPARGWAQLCPRQTLGCPTCDQPGWPPRKQGQDASTPECVRVSCPHQVLWGSPRAAEPQPRAAGPGASEAIVRAQPAPVGVQPGPPTWQWTQAGLQLGVVGPRVHLEGGGQVCSCLQTVSSKSVFTICEGSSNRLGWELRVPAASGVRHRAWTPQRVLPTRPCSRSAPTPLMCCREPGCHGCPVDVLTQDLGKKAVSWMRGMWPQEEAGSGEGRLRRGG